jgi:hypothetical protein
MGIEEEMIFDRGDHRRKGAKISLLICALLWVLVIRTDVCLAEAPRPLMRDFLGICGHTIGFKPALYAPVCTLARDYHPVEWDLDGQTDVLPDFPLAKNKVDWDAVYGSWRKVGYRTDVCLMFDSIKPDHWHDLGPDAGRYAAAFAKEFGPSAKKPLVDAVEIGNEPGNYSEAQYVTLLKSVAPSLRRADPRLAVATCNLSVGKSTHYSKSVNTLLADPAILPAIDVLTIHTYAQIEPYPTWRRSYPEDPKLKYLTDVTDLARWRDQHAAGKSIWITEFGYDATTNKPDPKTEFAHWVGVSDKQQAQYLVRSALIFSAMPVDRAYIYFFDDRDEAKLHASSGITRNFKPKPSYYALAHMQKTLGNYRFSRIVMQKPGELYAYEFSPVDAAANRIIVAWSPTGSERSVTAAVPIPTGSKIIRAERMPLNSRAVENVAISSADTVPIDESPLYLFVSQPR